MENNWSNDCQNNENALESSHFKVEIIVEQRNSNSSKFWWAIRTQPLSVLKRFLFYILRNATYFFWTKTGRNKEVISKSVS